MPRRNFITKIITIECIFWYHVIPHLTQILHTMDRELRRCEHKKMTLWSEKLDIVDRNYLNKTLY